MRAQSARAWAGVLSCKSTSAICTVASNRLRPRLPGLAYFRPHQVYRRPITRPASALFGLGKAGKQAADAAAAAAALRAETMLRMPLWQHFIKLLATVGAVLWVARQLSRLLHDKADRVAAGEEATWLPAAVKEEQQPRSQQPFWVVVLSAAVESMHRPAAVFLPIVSWTLSFHAAAMFLDVCTIHGAKGKLPGALGVAVGNALVALHTVQRLVYGMSEVAGIVFVVWIVIRLKERLVKAFVESDNGSAGPSDGRRSNQAGALERIVLPLSGLASWMACMCGGLMALHVLGINIQPLLTVGGVSGVIVGLSAQSVVSNMISGVNLFLSRPFVVGERIDIAHGSGAKWLTGYVERVDPMRTIVRTDVCLPVMIPNKVLADMIISNESRIARSAVVSNFRKPRQYQASLAVRYEDMDAVTPIVAAARKWLQSCASVDQVLPQFVGLQSLDNHACNIAIVLHTTAAAARDFGNFRQELLLELGSIVRSHKARLAMPTQITHVNGLDTAVLEVMGGSKGQKANIA